MSAFRSEYRHQLRKLFHGPVLCDISEQVWVDQEDGTKSRYCTHIWKEWFRQKFLDNSSTEALSDEKFLEFIFRVQEFAACEMGVSFSEQRSQA